VAENITREDYLRPVGELALLDAGNRRGLDATDLRDYAKTIASWESACES
jgi:hypothetical protein